MIENDRSNLLQLWKSARQQARELADKIGELTEHRDALDRSYHRLLNLAEGCKRTLTALDIAEGREPQKDIDDIPF